MKRLSLILLLAGASLIGNAQEKIAVINFDIVGKSLTKQQYVTITRTEIAKMERYQVLDKYTVQESLEKNPVNLDKCYGINCLAKIGSELKVKYVVSGSAEVIGDKAIISLRLIDVVKKETIKNSYSEFYWSEKNAQRLIQLAVYKLFDKEIDENLLNIYDYTRATQGNMEGPAVRRHNLSGPRFGGSYQTGMMENVITAGKSSGGFGKKPFMTVIGYQFEKQYLYTGPFQAVFQLNFSLTGLDQQTAVPSFSALNGFRATKSGWEFGFGPSFRLRKIANGFYREGDSGSLSWVLWNDQEPGENASKTTRMDSRGTTKLISSWVWAVGKSFKAGSMNIPINFYAIPDKDGWLFGLSMGYALHK
ncbi:MAG: TolB-like protein [Saprospiraceae bacterium]|jgi:TolB-like protein